MRWNLVIYSKEIQGSLITIEPKQFKDEKRWGKQQRIWKILEIVVKLKNWINWNVIYLPQEGLENQDLEMSEFMQTSEQLVPSHENLDLDANVKLTHTQNKAMTNYGGDISIITGSSKCVVIFHGYSDTPFEYKHVADEISMTIGADVIVPVLPHHGIDTNELLKANRAEAHEWGVQVLTGVRSRYEKLIVIGHSMGSGIAIYALLHGVIIDGLILTSVNGVPSKKVRFGLFATNMLHIQSFKTVFKSLRYHDFEPAFIDWKLKHFPRIWFNVFREAIETLSSYIKSIERITVPVMIILGAKDFAANVTRTSELYFTNIKSTKKTLLIVENTGHAVFFSPYFSQIMQQINIFIQDVLENGNNGGMLKRLKIF